MVVLLLIVHGLLSVMLLGALTHQSLSVIARPRAAARASFIDRFSAVNPAVFASPVVSLFALTCMAGGFLYPAYRLDARPVLEEMRLNAANGAFEIKEHFAAIGLGLLPTYWACWRGRDAGQLRRARQSLTWILAFIVWWNFLIGHVLNNLRGLLL
jgi:hypothetical protein